MKGKVYLIKAGEFCKIGITTNPIEKRIAQLQTACPQKIEVIELLEVPKPFEMEAYLHKVFMPRRETGEWFSLSEENRIILVAFMRNLRTLQEEEAKRIRAEQLADRYYQIWQSILNEKEEPTWTYEL